MILIIMTSRDLSMSTRLRRWYNDHVMLPLLLSCMVATLPILADQQSATINVGVLDLPEMVAYARESLSSCPYRENINLTVIGNHSWSGGTVLQQAENFKSYIRSKGPDYFAMIGPLLDPVVMVTENMDIAYIATETGYRGDARNIYYVLPEYNELVQCVLAIVNASNWSAVGVLWEHQSGIHVLSGFLDSSHIDIRMFRISANHSTDASRHILHQIREMGIRTILLMTSRLRTREILAVAKRLGMLTIPYSWLIVNYGPMDEIERLLFDLQTNVTVIHVMKNLTNNDLSSPGLDNISLIQAHAVIQGVQLMCDVIAMMQSTDTKNMNFENILEKLGPDSPIQFASDGSRVGFTWDIYSPVNYQLTKVAEWVNRNPEEPSGLQWNGSESVYKPHWSTQKVRVVSILEEPWMMEKSDNCNGSDCYYGFIVDMMKELAQHTIFNPPIDYELYIVPDGKFGSLDPDTGEWNGIMGEIMSGNAMMSLAPLSINRMREEAVDFTKPFTTRHIKVLIKASESQPSYFQFLYPLSLTVWGMILLAMGVVGLALGLYEKHGTRQRHDFKPITGQESCWFVFGTLMQEGTEVSPVTVAGRILTASWWFFAMILISTYTANLAAFLTVNKINTPIETISDLVSQSKIRYGTVKNSGVLNFFETTTIEPYQSMLSIIRENLVDNTSDALDLVRQGNYAFLWDNTVTSYKATVDCNFTEIGPGFDPKGFGIGVHTGATYEENLTQAVLSLKEDGKLDKLKQKWWQTDSGKCPSMSDSGKKPTDTEELKLENVAGIFFVLVGGLVLGLLACLFDKFFVVCRRNRQSSNGHAKAMNQHNTELQSPNHYNSRDARVFDSNDRL